MHWQRQLFLSNCCKQPYSQAVLAREQDWITNLVSQLSERTEAVTTWEQFKACLQRALGEDAQASEESRFVADDATRDAFEALMGQYAVDGLTEAQAMVYAIPRLPAAVQMPVMRVLIDEFGCGNLRASHSQLYRNLLSELALPIKVGQYLDGTRPEVFAFVNVYHWLTRRAPAVDLYLGALAYAEAVVPLTFRAFESACTRLGLTQKAYFSEHIHIDEFHARDALAALRALDSLRGTNFTQAWLGVCLAREIGNRAFRAAVAAARQGVRSWATN